MFSGQLGLNSNLRGRKQRR